MTLREQVARAMVAALGMNPDDTDNLTGKTRWEAELPQADSAIRIITEACAKVAEDTADDSVDGASIARRIRQMGKP